MKHLTTLSIIALSLIMFTVAHAQSNCAAFNDEIESSLKEIASTNAQGVVASPNAQGNSITFGAFREQRISNELARIQINLKLMEANKCKMPRGPITRYDYFAIAVSCYADELIELKNKNEKKDSQKCDKKNWKR